MSDTSIPERNKCNCCELESGELKEDFLSRAILKRNLTEVNQIIQNGVDINGYSTVIDLKYENLPTRREETPLITASRLGYLEIVMILLDQGASVDMFAKDINMTALHWACNRGHLSIVEVLVQNNADVNLFGEYDFTPIIEATVNDHFEILKYLLEHGAIINYSKRVSETSETPLHASIVLDQPEMSELLIQHGTNVRDIDGTGQDALTASIPDYHPSLMKMLVYAGCPIKQIHIDSVKMVPNHTPDVLEWMQNVKTKPFSLRRLCRFNIRSNVIGHTQGSSILSSIQKLPIPQWLQDFLMLKYL